MGRRSRSRHCRTGTAVAAAAVAIALGMTGVRAQSDQSRPMRLTVNHAEAISLQSNPAVALIANPDIADIVSEKNNLVFVLGRKPGATNLLVYDENGQPLLNREIVVMPDAGKEVTITRETDVIHYYCEPGCVFLQHEGGGTAPNVTPTPVAAAAGAGQAPAGGQPTPQVPLPALPAMPGAAPAVPAH